MANSRWLVKTEPSTYSFADLQRDKRTRWDGVSNPVALKHLRSMHPGDEVMVYHTGDEKAIVGLAHVVSDPYADPKLKDPRMVVVDLEAVRALPKPVTLAAIKADRRCAELPLVRMGRLSVMPIPAALWPVLLSL